MHPRTETLVRRRHIIENGSGICTCGHPSSHHTPPAVAERRCERLNCTCRTFSDERGLLPHGRPSVVTEHPWGRQAREILQSQYLGRDIYVTEEAVPGKAYEVLVNSRPTEVMHPLDWFAIEFAGDFNRHLHASLDWQLLQIARNARAAHARVMGRL